MNGTETQVVKTVVNPSLASQILPLLIVVGCFVIVLLLLRLAAKASWLTSIAAALVIATVPSILGIRMLNHGPGSPVDAAWMILLPGATGVVILIIQFFRWLFTAETAQARVNTAERSRILKLVEDGKISSDEGSELLDAMGRSSALRGQDRFSRIDIAMLIAVALVILGFFLPWAYITRGIYQAGHQRGPIGWTVLIVAVLSVIPVFVTPKELLYKISMLQIFLILVGLVLLIKELIQITDNLGAGLVFCIVGFFLALLSSGFKLKSLAA
ncbi:MAG: SHOCT-like domain-containing protein [Planctomycetota bacterium]|jgi:hypothetical protein